MCLYKKKKTHEAHQEFFNVTEMSKCDWMNYTCQFCVAGTAVIVGGAYIYS